MDIGKSLGGVFFAAAAGVLLLPQGARAVPGGEANFDRSLFEAPLPGAPYNPPFVLAFGNAWPIANLWTANPDWTFATSRYSPVTGTATFDDSRSPVFDIARYDPMWNDGLFSEIAAYGGLSRDMQRVASMRAIGGFDGTEGIPYGRLTLQHEYLEGQDQLTLGAYGMHVNVRPTAISGFGDDSYTDLAADAAWRWSADPARKTSPTFVAHILVLRESEGLNASHAVFGTRSTDDLTVLRGGISEAWSAALMPGIQYFQVSGSSDPLRLGTVEGSPDSKGWIAEIAYNGLAPLHARVALQFIAYSEFDGVTGGSSQHDTVLLHLTLGAGPDF